MLGAFNDAWFRYVQDIGPAGPDKGQGGKYYDIYFAPKPPEGYENNWIETVPGKGWFVALRMYGPLEAWIDKTWRPGEIELVG